VSFTEKPLHRYIAICKTQGNLTTVFLYLTEALQAYSFAPILDMTVLWSKAVAVLCPVKHRSGSQLHKSCCFWRLKCNAYLSIRCAPLSPPHCTSKM